MLQVTPLIARRLRMFRVERLNLYRYASLHPFGVREGTGRTR
jgi:hypothetical protein